MNDIEIFLAKFLNRREKEALSEYSPTLTKKANLFLCQEQLIALDVATKQKFSIITGGGGSGKTTIIKYLTDSLFLADINYVVCSFTGKAVSRIKREINSERIMTLHRLLIHKHAYLTPSDNNLLTYIIIDEASMVPNILFYRILQSLDLTTLRIVFIGDPNQLPPIGSGEVFKKIIKTHIPVTELLIDHRRTGGENSVLRNNLRDFTLDNFTFGEDCVFLKGGLGKVKKMLRDFKRDEISARNFKIITPLKDDKDKVNDFARGLFVDIDEADTYKDLWFTGDKIIITENNYRYNVMNGEEGEIVKITDTHINIVFDRNNAEISFDLRDPVRIRVKLDLSWGITIHKSEGSEWEIIVIYLKEGMGNFVNKRLLYTAMSRPKDVLYVVASDKSVLYNYLSRSCDSKNDNLRKRMRDYHVIDY